MIYNNLYDNSTNDFNEDGIPDQIEIETDIDGDGIPNDLTMDFDETEVQFIDSDLDIIDPDPIGEEYVNSLLPEPDALETADIATVDIADDMEHWHEQTYDDTCGIVAQEYILDDIGQAYGIDFSEDELRDTAAAAGWYTPDGGTPMMQVGNLLEAYGIGVEKSINASLDDIDQQLEAGHKVLVAVDADEIWNPNDIDDDDLIANLQGMPGQSPNHTVQVIGIDNSDPNNPMVILNDPGTPDGQGLTVPADDFLNAWSDSNNFMVATTGHNVNPNQTEFAFEGESSYMDNIRLGSVAEGDNQKYWGDSYQRDADNASYWANSYASDGNTDKALEYSRSAAVAQDKANEYHNNAMDEYSST
ncbi:MAG: hypothetical protein ACRC80_27125 [Waterburya sp.]